MIQLELTDDEAHSLLKLLINSTNNIIAKGDPDNILEHLERVEEKIIGAMDDAAIKLARIPMASTVEN
jgi:hypothetical protein